MQGRKRYERYGLGPALTAALCHTYGSRCCIWKKSSHLSSHKRLMCQGLREHNQSDVKTVLTCFTNMWMQSEIEALRSQASDVAARVANQEKLEEAAHLQV